MLFPLIIVSWLVFFFLIQFPVVFFIFFLLRIVDGKGAQSSCQWCIFVVPHQRSLIFDNVIGDVLLQYTSTPPPSNATPLRCCPWWSCQSITHFLVSYRTVKQRMGMHSSLCICTCTVRFLIFLHFLLLFTVSMSCLHLCLRILHFPCFKCPIIFFV